MRQAFEHIRTVEDMPLYALSWDEFNKLVQYHGRERDVVIPSGLGVRWIGMHAFGDLGDQGRLPEGFTQPFCDWKNIRSVVIPEGVVGIGFGAFRGCTGLQSVTLPSTLEHIGPSAFEGCTSLREVKLPDSLREIASSAFEGCASLRDVVLPDSLLKIGNRAFEGCRFLTDIRFPQGMEEIGSWAFEGCESLGEVLLQQTQGKLEVGENAFRGSGITSLTIEGDVSLGEGCFQRCGQLESVEILDAYCDEERSTPPGATAPVLVGLEALPDSAFEHCTSLDSVDLPSTLLSVGDKAFAGCERLFSVELPDSVREIGARAFDGCSLLWSIDIPAGVETIRAQTFSSCRALSRVSLSEGLRTIEGRAFGQCRVLGRIVLPSSVKEVAPLAFEGCERLSEVTIAGEGCRGTFYRSAFSGCPVADKTAPIDGLPGTATLVNDAAFAGMFDGPAHELRALRFDTFDYESEPRHLGGFLVVDRGVEGLNRSLGVSVDGEEVEFWIELDEGCDRGYFAVRNVLATPGSGQLSEGYLEPKGEGRDSHDPSRRHFGSVKGSFFVYLSRCHLMAPPCVDGARAARVVDAYRSKVAPLVAEYRRVEKGESGLGGRPGRNKLAALDRLHDQVQSANEQFARNAASTGLDCRYYIRRYAGTIGTGYAPSKEAARIKEAKRIAKSHSKEMERRGKAEARADLFLAILTSGLNGCFWIVAIALAVIVSFGLMLMILFI